MRSEGNRWEPPAFLVTNFRGLVLSWFVVAFMLLGIMGGETLRCEGTAAGWRCERREESGMGRAVDLLTGTDALSGPNKRTKTRITQRRGQYRAVVTTDSGDLMLPSQPSEELAEADRKAWLRWAKAPKGTLTLEGPTPGRNRFGVWAITLLVAAGTFCTAWVNLRPPVRSPGQVPKRRGRM